MSRKSIADTIFPTGTVLNYQEDYKRIRLPDLNADSIFSRF